MQFISQLLILGMCRERTKQDTAVYFYVGRCGCEPSVGWGVSDFKAVAHKTVVELFDLAKQQQSEIKLLKKERDDLQKRIDEYEKLTTSIRNEFNLWTDGREFADVIEAQIENLEVLRGEHE